MDSRVELMSNMLDALDKLFDGKVDTSDVGALAYATALAMGPEDCLLPTLESTVVALQGLVLEGLQPHAERARALEVTNCLRITLADALSSPECISERTNQVNDGRQRAED